MALLPDRYGVVVASLIASRSDGWQWVGNSRASVQVAMHRRGLVVALGQVAAATWVEERTRGGLGEWDKERVDRRIAESWDSEYETGRYQDDTPVAFVRDIVAAARDAGLIGTEGLYIGCGNGRNYLPLVSAGLDLVGLDVSVIALEQLAQRMPERRSRLVHGDLSALPKEQRYQLVIGIQVFQHGDRASAHAHIRSAQERLGAGGLFCVRVNAVATDVAPRHEVTERHVDSGFTVRYLEGPKEGLHIHFFSLDELSSLFGDGYEPVVPPRLQRMWRTPRSRGQWSQWEAIWRRAS